MPTQSQWLVQLPKIIRELRQLKMPVVDRTCIEQLFGVGRRRAIQLMHSFGGYQSGKTFLVDRAHLIVQLTAAAEGDNYIYEVQRRKRVSEEVRLLKTAIKGAAISVPVDPEVYATTGSALPPGVQLERGCLTIRFTSGEQLAQQLFTVAQAMANDFGSFQP